MWTGQEWERVRLENGEVYGKSVSFLPLTIGGLPAVRVSHGEVSEVRWTLDRQIMSTWRHHFERIIRSGRFLDRWSLFRLPLDYQERKNTRSPPPRFTTSLSITAISPPLNTKLTSLRQFVVKPARGAGGSGILLIVDRTPEEFSRQNGEIITQEDLSYHISSIISGIHSLEGLEDRALIEALVIPDPIFAAVTYQGVPDIRIVLYRGIPVMAMVRLPTRASDGKANLHRGAIGAGIEIQHGITTTAVHHSLIVTHHPDTGHPVGGIHVPQWEKVLIIAARASDMTGLGYVGVDIVVDRDCGPLLLELNARPGLAIQLANRIGLLGRLEQVEKGPPDIFPLPEARVAWAMGTFG